MFVGAQRRHFTFLAFKTIRIEFTSVVLLTPSPPVMITTRFKNSFQRLALVWARVFHVRCWHRSTAFHWCTTCSRLQHSIKTKLA
jgi:hypothetical protein